MEESPLHDHLPKAHCHAQTNPRLKLHFSSSIIHDEMQEKADQERRIGESFFKQGELRLLHGDLSGLQFFDLAIQLNPKSATLLYEQGLALLDYASEKGKGKHLPLASKRFKQAVRLDPSLFEAWHAWGNTLFTLANETHEHHFYIEAEQKFKTALSLSKDQSHDILADLHWNYGCVWSELSKKSKEPSDMNHALEAFEKASQLQEDLSNDFWHDFGQICLSLGVKVNDLRYFFKAINCFKNAVSIAISSYESWFLLGNAFKCLYSFTHDEDHFNQANECFSTAAQLNSKDAKLWHQWAIILCESGREIKDAKRLRSSIEKCHKAHSCERKNPLILSTWAEALATLGLLNDKVNLLYDAQNKVSDAISLDPDNPELYYSFGFTLQCLGQYFNDLDYLYQAIEKFQEGLDYDRTYHKLWHALGFTYYMAALIEDENKTFDLAHKFFQKAISLHGCSRYFYHFGLSLLKYAEVLIDQKLLEYSIENFEQALHLQKNAIYLHPDWLFHYGIALDMLGEMTEDKEHYVKALEILHHVLMVDPEHQRIHYQLALTFTHYGDLISEVDPLHRALHHYKLAIKRDEENDHIILDWALSLATLAELLQDSEEASDLFKEAEFKMTGAAKLGNTHAYYHLACLFSLTGKLDQSFYFIKKAHEYDVLPSPQELIEDEWLENLRTTSHFQNFLTTLENRSDIKEF